MPELEYRRSAPLEPRRPGETGLLARGLKLRQLALLAAVDRTGQIAAAAQSLNMTQPAASRMLAQLEGAAGVALTERLPRGVRLTAAGQRLAHSARRILGEIDAAGRAVAEKILDSFTSCPIPEVARLGRTLKQWRTEFLGYFDTNGASNGGTEAINGLIELHRRVARGFRNRDNYRLRMLLIGGGLDRSPHTHR